MKRVSKIVVCTLIFSLLCGTVAFAMDNAISNVLRAKVNVAEIKYEGELLFLSGTIKTDKSELKKLTESGVRIDAEKGEAVETKLDVELTEDYKKGKDNPRVEGVQIAIEISKTDDKIKEKDFTIKYENEELKCKKVKGKDSYIVYITPEQSFDVIGDDVVKRELDIIFNNEAEYDLVFYAVYADEKSDKDTPVEDRVAELIEELKDKIDSGISEGSEEIKALVEEIKDAMEGLSDGYKEQLEKILDKILEDKM